jgi:D-arabinose 1-dehydrogenase-like Zn-dependent alcohol dehydrogenase
MKAIVIHGPSDARYEEVPVKPPQEGEVVIQIKAIGLCGTDYELYTNEMVYIKEGLCKLPMIPGHEWFESRVISDGSQTWKRRR